MKFFKKATDVISEEGIATFFRKALKFTAFNLIRVRKVNIYELSLENSARGILPQVEISFRLAEITDIESMDEEHYNYNPQAKEYSVERLMKGDECVLALYHDKIVGYVWVMKGYMELSRFKHIKIPKDKAYIYNNFVLKEFRGKRILNAMDTFVIEKLRKEDKKYLLTTVAQDNKPPVKARDRMGFEKKGEILYIKLLGFIYPYISKRNLNYLIAP